MARLTTHAVREQEMAETEGSTRERRNARARERYALQRQDADFMAKRRARHNERRASDPEFAQKLRDKWHQHKAKRDTLETPEAKLKRRKKAAQRTREWREANADRYKASALVWRKHHGAKYVRHRRTTDLHYNVASRLRCRIADALRRGSASKAADLMNVLGCSLPDFILHIESLFQDGMTWENRSQWEIDHIRPCKSFDLSDPEQQKLCFHFKNLRPLWRSENRRKGAKWMPVPELSTP